MKTLVQPDVQQSIHLLHVPIRVLRSRHVHRNRAIFSFRTMFRNNTWASLDQTVLAWQPERNGMITNLSRLKSFAVPAFVGSGCGGCRLLEVDAATISLYGARITFVPFTLVPEADLPMWHTGLTVDRRPDNKAKSTRPRGVCMELNTCNLIVRTFGFA